MRLKRMYTLLLAMVMVFSLTLTATAEVDLQVDFGISNPKIVTDSSMTAGQKTTWDCIYFGSYPQAEVVASEDYGAIDSAYLEDGDIIVDSELYAKFASADWDEDHTTTIDGSKYYRMKHSDATFTSVGLKGYYSWSSGTGIYRYFKFEPIKWRVLSVDSNGTALLLADKALDDLEYNAETSVTWETSSIRKWLNDTFLNRAFSSDDQEAIESTTVVNNDSNYYGTEGGDDTEDQIFLLAESDVFTNYYTAFYGGNAQKYGFAADSTTYDEARRCQSTTFAKAKGTFWRTTDANCAGNCCWWLRSPGKYTYYAAYVYDAGWTHMGGDYVDIGSNGCRPALKINLSSSNLWSKAGTVCSDGTTVCAHPDRMCMLQNTVAATTSKDGYTGDTYCTACNIIVAEGTVIPKIQSVTLSATAYTYDGKEKTPSVTVKDSAGNTIDAYNYTVTMPSERINAGKYTCTIEFNDPWYSGTKTLNFTINPKNASNFSVKASATTYTYNGKAQMPSVVVKDAAGKTISSGNYTVVKPSGRKNVGKYTYTIKYKGNYTGSKTLSYTIKPKGTAIASLAAASKGFTVKWKKQATQTTGYQIQYSTSSKFTSYKTVTVSGSSTTSKKISNLSAKKKYYVRIRTYKTVSGTKYYSAWSSAKSVKTK